MDLTDSEERALRCDEYKRRHDQSFYWFCQYAAEPSPDDAMTEPVERPWWALEFTAWVIVWFSLVAFVWWGWTQ